MSPEPAFHRPAPAPEEPEAEFYRDTLHELIALGTRLARIIVAQAEAASEPADTAADPAETTPSRAVTPDLAVAFERTARAVRRTVALARSLDRPAPSQADAQHRAAARRRILREVEDVIQRGRDPAQAADLHEELLDRLDGPDLDQEITTRPVADIVADICRDLGIAALPGTRPWKRRTPADIATLCARAAAPDAARTAGPKLLLHPTRVRGKPAPA